MQPHAPTSVVLAQLIDDVPKDFVNLDWLLRHHQKLPVALGYFLSADDSPWKLLMSTGQIYALPPAAIYYAFKRYMVGGLTAGAVKS